jgi:LPPG:FO 2-phospho-L-lactate transferase
MLAIPELRAAIAACPSVIAVSPIIAGQAVKGPAAKIMRELGIESTALEVARFYHGLICTLVIDRADAALADPIRLLGMDAAVDDILMRNDVDRERLARACMELLVRMNA